MPPIEDEPKPHNGPGPYGLVWEALDRFSEALRDLDGEVRALAHVFKPPHERKGLPDDTPDRVRRTHE